MVLGGGSQCQGGEEVSVPTSLLPFLAVGAGRNSTLSSPTGIVGMGEVELCAVPAGTRCPTLSGRDSWSQHEVSAAQVVNLAPSEHPPKPGMIQGLRPQLGKAAGGGVEWNCHCVVVSICPLSDLSSFPGQSGST